MKQILLTLSIILFMVIPVSATNFTVPEAPDAAERYMPQTSSNFGEDLCHVLKKAMQDILPEITEAAEVCLAIIAIIMLTTILQNFSGPSRKVIVLICTLGISFLLLSRTKALITLGRGTVTELSEYGKLLLPVMSAVMAAQGGTATSTALHIGTAVFNSVLTTFIAKLIVPMIYIYLCLSVANCVTGEQTMRNLQDFTKWLSTWSLKIILYIFTGYMGITGVVSGATDAAALKAVKLTISGTVPIVGNILSDASESILISAGLMKNTAGVYGMIAIIAIFIGPFLKIGIQYLLLMLTSGIVRIFGTKESVELVKSFSGAMGLILAMTGTVCLLLLISIVCFMKGVS